MFKTLIAALSTVLMLPSAPFAAPNSEQVELTIDRTGGVTIPVTVNGHGRFVFMLDTRLDSLRRQQRAGGAGSAARTLSSARSESRPGISR